MRIQPTKTNNVIIRTLFSKYETARSYTSVNSTLLSISGDTEQVTGHSASSGFLMPRNCVLAHRNASESFLYRKSCTACRSSRRREISKASPLSTIAVHSLIRQTISSSSYTTTIKSNNDYFYSFLVDNYFVFANINIFLEDFQTFAKRFITYICDHVNIKDFYSSIESLVCTLPGRFSCLCVIVIWGSIFCIVCFPNIRRLSRRMNLWSKV